MSNCKDGASNYALRDNSIDAMSTAIDEIDISDDGSINEDDELFQEPPPKEDCQICFLPMPHSSGICGVPNPIYHPCCGKMVCSGCVKASINEMNKGNLKRWCSYCRVPLPRSDKEYVKRIKKRMKLNEAEAFYELGTDYRDGNLGLSKDLNKVLELWNQAAELGSINAHYELALCLYYGKWAEKDKKKAIQHYKLAAIGGHERARHNLGLIEMSNGNMDRSMKHHMIAAKSGHDESLKEVGIGYKAGLVTKDEYVSTLRAYQQTIDQMKSKEREEARVHLESRRNINS